MIIYKTINLINKKIYIGQLKDETKNTYLGSGKILKQAIEKYGKENFKRITLEKCANRNELNLAEIKWIKKLNSTDKKIGYNIAFGGYGGGIYSFPIESQIKFKNAMKIYGKKMGKRRRAGNFTKNELIGHKKSSDTQKENFKKFGLTKKQKLGYKKMSKRKLAGNYTKKEIKRFQKLKKTFISPTWLGYLYIYDIFDNIIYKFKTIKKTINFLNIGERTLKKIINEEYLDLKKHPRLKNKLLHLDGCKFIQKKEKLN